MVFNQSFQHCWVVSTWNWVYDLERETQANVVNEQPISKSLLANLQVLIEKGWAGAHKMGITVKVQTRLETKLSSF